MSFSDHKTVELWKSFMPRRKEIQNNIGSELYSIEVYNPLFFQPMSELSQPMLELSPTYNPETIFEKWAAIEVTDFNTVPDDMETITLTGGLYAVFVHKGPASAGPKTYQYIFETGLPNSGFILDNRPHFAVMGEKYKNEDINSEEEIWIPIKPKK
jgi:AraC family transcriptional regulator